MNETGDGMTDMLSKAIADPRFAEIFTALKSKADSGELDVSALSGMLGGTEKEEGQPAAVKESEPVYKDKNNLHTGAKITDAFDMLSPLLTSSGKAGAKETQKHEALLRALKPYLTDSKKNAVDSILKAAKLGELVEVFSSLKKDDHI